MSTCLEKSEHKLSPKVMSFPRKIRIQRRQHSYFFSNLCVKFDGLFQHLVNIQTFNETYFRIAFHDFCPNRENLHHHLSVYRVRVTVHHTLKNNGKTDFSTSNVILEIVGCCGKWQSWIKMPPLVFCQNVPYVNIEIIWHPHQVFI